LSRGGREREKGGRKNAVCDVLILAKLSPSPDVEIAVGKKKEGGRRRKAFRSFFPQGREFTAVVKNRERESPLFLNFFL